MNSKNDHDIQEFLRCDLGGVSISLSAPRELQEALSKFDRQMAEFLTDKAVDLRMVILKPKPPEPVNGCGYWNEFTKPFVYKKFQKEFVIEKQKRLANAEKLLAWLRLDPVVNARFQDIAALDGSVSIVPLTSGCLCINIESGDALLLLRQEHRTQGVYWAFPRVMHASVTAVNAVMAHLAVYMAQRGDGIVAHGAGVSFQGNGYLFLAPSGGGKTTLSKCTAPGSVLADDGIIIREDREGYRLYPTPLRQGLGGNIAQRSWHRSAVKLRAAFLLDKGSQTLIKSAARKQLMGLLIHAMTHFFLWMQPQQTTQVFDFWRRLSLTVPIAEFQWRLGSEFWSTVDNFLNKGVENEIRKETAKLA